MKDCRQIVLETLKFNDSLSIITQDNMVTDIIHNNWEQECCLIPLQMTITHTKTLDLHSVNIILGKGNHAVNKQRKSDNL